MTDVINLSESTKEALHIAQSLAKEYKSSSVTAAHLLRGLMHKDIGLDKFLASIGQDRDFIIEWAEVRIDEVGRTTNVNIKHSEVISSILDEADDVRVKIGLDLITPITVLTALIKPGIAFTPDQLKSFPLKERDILDVFLKDSQLQDVIATGSATSNPIGDVTGNKQGTAAIYQYCIDRIAEVNNGKTLPIIGREKELRMMMEVLCRKTKPNVIITGDAGVGKTALVDGFALNIVAGTVPENLKNSALFELDLGSLMAGASYKGEVEDRMKKIIKDLKKFDKAVLFIDEIHTLLDAKGPMGSGVGNLLKPELARGELTVIGATTLEEYRKIIEPEQAFSRRFDVLKLNEPDFTTAEKMLELVAPFYQKHHQLEVPNDVLGECVRLAKRYFKDKRLPDAALDLMDKTLSALKLLNDTSALEINTFQTTLGELSGTDMDDTKKLKEYKWLNRMVSNKLSPILLGQIEDNTEPEQMESVPLIHDYLDQLLKKLLTLIENKHTAITVQDLFSIISHQTGIPIGKIQSQEKERLLNIENHLKQRVIGQDAAIKAVSNAIIESRSGLNKKGQPIGSFFLLGPTGTGKTELAKSIADFLFNDEKTMIRFDMSEFKEEHSAALLYGAPPGYVGYEEGGLLVNKIRQQPYAVLLFDEIEKAHPSVFDIFLQIMDEGTMHDRLGKEGDFSNALILFTSNIGSDWIAEQVAKNHIPVHNELLELMGNYFRPEFLARLSEIVPFVPISEDIVVKIFDIQLKSLLEPMTKMGIKLHISDDAKEMLALTGFTPKYGARQISGVIRNQLRRPVSKYIVSGEVKSGDVINVSLDADKKLFWKIN